MRKLPEAIKIATTQEMLQVWLGLNKGYRMDDGEFANCKNITNDFYPVLSPRKKRGIVGQIENPNAFAATDKLMWVDGTQFYYNNTLVEGLELEDSPKQIVQMGALCCIFPDKVIYNTHDGSIKHMEAAYTSTDEPTFTLAKMDGTVYDATKTFVGDTAPSTTTYRYWIDTSADPVVMKLYDANSQSWTSVGTTYVKVSATGIGRDFEVYDAVRFENVDKDNPAIYNDYDFNTTNVIYAKGDDYVVIVGFINKQFTNSRNITLKREVPDMDFVTELNNRIWGCSSFNHEVYACKLGDPTNWNCYMGLSSDSYAATIGTEGNFTGAISYRNYVLFFKDNGIHKIYGTLPSNYEVTWTACRGVQEGSEKSLAIVNEYLYYLSRNGFVVYDGSFPEDISTKLGNVKYSDAIAGVYRSKYYVSCFDEDEYHILVFDTEKGTWLEEDEQMVHGFAYYDGGLYFIGEDKKIYVINSDCVVTKLFPAMPDDEFAYPSETLFPAASYVGQIEDDFEWSAETGDFGLENPYEKYYSQVTLRLMVESGARLKVEIQYDSSGVWDQLIELTATTKRSYALPINVNRCDHMRFRFSGKGDVKVLSMAKRLETGSEQS